MILMLMLGMKKSRLWVIEVEMGNGEWEIRMYGSELCLDAVFSAVLCCAVLRLAYGYPSIQRHI